MHSVLYAIHVWGVKIKRETWGITWEWETEINRGNKTWYSLKHFLLFCGNSTQICGNPLLEFMLWKQGRGGRRGITAFSLSLRDHNDDKESITVLHWWYVHSWGDSQSAGCPGLPLHFPTSRDNFGGCSLSAIGEEQYRLQQHEEEDFWQRKSIQDDSNNISILSLVSQY